MLKNKALLVTIFLISGFIHITSEVVLVKVYVRRQGIMTILETGNYIKQLFRINNAKAEQLHRQEKDLASKHIPLLKMTMSNRVEIAAVQWCLPIVQKIYQVMKRGFSQTVHTNYFLYTQYIF